MANGILAGLELPTIADLRALPKNRLDTLYTYRTAGYATAYDGGGAYYYWDPTDTGVDDGCLTLLPTGWTGPGRLRARAAGGAWDLRASPMSVDRTGATDYGLFFQTLNGVAPQRGITKLILPPWRVPCQGWAFNGLPCRDPRVAISNIEWIGTPGGSLSGPMLRVSELPYCRLAATSLPAFTAAGAGATRTLTMNANGAGVVDSVAVALSDRVLYCPAAGSNLAGIYTVTQVGDGSHPMILTRSTDWSSSANLVVRAGVFIALGTAYAKSWWVLSNLPGTVWTDSPMTLETSVQYWSQEGFAQGFVFCPTTDIPFFFHSGNIPSYTPQNWSGWMAHGATVLPNVQGRSGGVWTDPIGGEQFTYLPLNVGNKIILTAGGTPTDQGGYACFQKSAVKNIDSGGNVTISTPVRTRATFVYSAGVPGSYAAGGYPSYNLNQNVHNADNQYANVTQDATNLRFTNVVFDGMSPTFTACDDVFLDGCTIKNAHIGIQWFGCDTRCRTKNLAMENITPWSQANATAPFDAYGWAVQSNTSANIIMEGTIVNGLSADFVDIEAANEIRFNETELILKPYVVGAGGPYPRQQQAILGSTGNQTKINRMSGLTLKGYCNATPTATYPIRDLVMDMAASDGTYTGMAVDSWVLSGTLYMKGRRYEMGSRRPWRCVIPLQPSVTKLVRRPYFGLWANTRIYKSLTLSDITKPGIITFGFNDGGGSSVLFEPGLQAAPNNAWSNLGTDQMSNGFPNWFDGQGQYITISTDAFVVAGSYLVITTDVIQPQDRGDGYIGESPITQDNVPGLGLTSTLMKVVPDTGAPETLYGPGAPGSTPGFQGQRYIDYTGGAIYEAIDTTGAGDWKKLTP